MDYQKTAKNALALIAKNGKSYAITRPRPVFNKATGEIDPASPEPLTGNITAVILPNYKGKVFESMDNAFKASLIKGYVRTVLAAALGAPFEPDANDVIAFGGFNWLVIGCTPLAPADIPLIYTIGVIRV